MPGSSRSTVPVAMCAVGTILGLLLAAPPARGVFTESAVSYGIAGPDSMSYGGAFPDLDGDGDPDFYANHHWAGPGEIWRNDGAPPWVQLPSPFSGAPDRHDIVWGDLDNDGAPDAYVNHGGDQANELLWNDGGGLFQEGAAAAGVQDVTGRGREISLFDADNDGRLEVFCVNDTRPGFIKPSVLFYNEGNRGFSRFPNIYGMFAARLHVAAADFDLDGDVDVITTNPPYVDGEFWRSEGTLLWTNVTAFTFPGITDPLKQANGLTWSDYDNDGDLDLLACGGNRAMWDYAGLEGDSLRFSCETASAETKSLAVVVAADSITVWAQTSTYQPVWLWYGAAGESTAVFPVKLAIADAAGSPPQRMAGIRRGLFLASFPVAAGDSLVFSVGGSAVGPDLFVGGSLRPEGATLSWEKFGFTARPGFSLGDFRNRLYRNDLNGTFAEVTSTAFPVNPADVSTLNAAWGDYDNDGWIDVYMCNSGNIEIGNLPNWLFRNNGDGTFTEVAAAEGVSGSARGFTDGSAWADVNGDGFLDLFVVHGAEHPPFGVGPRELFLNPADNGNHWIQLQLRGVASNGSGIGARIRFVTAAGVQWRWRLGESDNCYSDQTIVHAGLGSSATVDTLQVYWPAGTIDTFVDVPADRSWWAIEGGELRPAQDALFVVPQESVADSLDEGQTTAWTVVLDNPGGIASAFGAHPESCDGSPVPWLTVAPDTGGVWPGGRTITVLADAAGLPLGPHCGRVVFTTNGLSGPDTLLVDLTVTMSPVGVALPVAPEAFALGPPRPNPARGPVEIALALPAEGPVRAEVLGIDGRRVTRLVDGVLPSGRHTLRWDRRDGAGSRVAAGVYFLQVEASSGRGIRKITLVD